MKHAALSFPSVILPLTLVLSGGVAAQTKQPQPSLRETLHWMQTSLQSGSGDHEVYHEIRSVRLEDFVGCKVHFSYSEHQVPYANGEPATEPNKTYHVDYLFELGDIDPTNIIFSKGLGLRADDKGLYELPSLITIRTRNDEKRITTELPWQSKADSKPDDTYIMFGLDSIDSDYVVRFAKAFKHAVETCGGKPSLFADSLGQGSDKQAPSAQPAQTSAKDPLDGIGIPATPQTEPPRKDIPAIAKAANGAIVTIITENNDKPIALGTGFLVSADGVIVTNYHVIETGNVAIVKFPDGTAFPVDGVLAADKVRDLAIIKIHGKTFPTVALGDSDRVQVGEEVVAIGNPLSLESTVSNGIISGVRTDKEAGGKFLQVTAPITHGSSGGPLFNMMGEVIGITTLGFEGAGNLNFAIPVNDAKLLLSHQSAKVQNLPNEAGVPKESVKEPAKVSPDVPPSLDQKVACNELARRSYEKHTMVNRLATDVIYRSSWTGHLNAETSTCFVIIKDTMKNKDTSPNAHKDTDFAILVYDAVEDTVYAQVTQFLPDNTFVDQEELPSAGFVKDLTGDVSKWVLVKPDDNKKGLTWFRLAVHKNFGIDVD